MSISSKIGMTSIAGPATVLGPMDFDNIMVKGMNSPMPGAVMVGIVEQFNVGMYSALVSFGEKMYSCFIGAQTITPTIGYSDISVLREGDEVLFFAAGDDDAMGMILARKPQMYSSDEDHPQTIVSETGMDRRSCFSSSHCYRRESEAYTSPLSDQDDISSLVCVENRPTDIVPGETGSMNQHRCGWIGGLYSMTVLGGGAHIRMSALDNRIRMVADSIVRHTMSGNEYDWHAGRYLSRERYSCMYQEERLGSRAPGEAPFQDADYHKDGYFTKNREDRQTARSRMSEFEGYSGNLYARYFYRPDPGDSGKPRSANDLPVDPGVARESIDPSGQYRLAATGMLGTERIGRIPVPARTGMPWQKGMDEQPASGLSEFKHSEDHPFYRQLELADRVAYDMKNSYARMDEDDGFHVPNEEDIEAGRLKDVYDEGFTGSRTVSLQKYDRRRSGIWQGEDGSIILRDAWGSEIVMIGGNIQLACAGNIQIMPARTAMVVAGDDIVQKAQRSVDIHASKNDVRIDAARNIQVMAGIDDDNPGGVTIEAVGGPAVWGTEDIAGGENVSSRGILLKSESGSLATDAATVVVRSKNRTCIVSGDEKIDGTVMVSSKSIYGYGEQIDLTSGASSLLMSDSSSILTGGSVVVAGKGSCTILAGEKVLVPLMWVPIGKNVAEEIEEKLQVLVDMLSDEYKASAGYSREALNGMKFVFRSSSECRTDESWEIGGDSFTLYEPFWAQVSTKFETLQGVSQATFDDNYDLWKSAGRGFPWPGDKALEGGKYAQLAGGSPANMDQYGFNRRRDEVSSSTEVSEVLLRDGYLVRE